jgi:pSer/pThr/pTyr-binding forkhead associated (FHA) protein
MGNTPPVELMIMSGPDDGTVLRLAEPKQGEAYLIGRREDCDVALTYDNQVSRHHSRLFLKDGQWHVQDLDSRNGTYVGKQRIDGIAPLAPGQMFRMGRTWLRLQSSLPRNSEG